MSARCHRATEVADLAAWEAGYELLRADPARWHTLYALCRTLRWGPQWHGRMRVTVRAPHIGVPRVRTVWLDGHRVASTVEHAGHDLYVYVYEREREREAVVTAWRREHSALVTASRAHVIARLVHCARVHCARGVLVGELDWPDVVAQAAIHWTDGQEGGAMRCTDGDAWVSARGAIRAACRALGAAGGIR